ncbi:MAG: hypothetical protein K8R24_03595 [Mycobacterium sp.]|jgi:hypothetical protein|nr:hypothetical protein [Mycobacterium sp.]
MRRKAVTAVLAAALCGAGCAGTPESKPPPERAPDSASVPAPAPGAHGGLAECLHANGVPDSTGPAAVLGPPTDVDPGVWDRAMTACSTLAPGPPAP